MADVFGATGAVARPAQLPPMTAPAPVTDPLADLLRTAKGTGADKARPVVPLPDTAPTAEPQSMDDFMASYRRWSPNDLANEHHARFWTQRYAERSGDIAQAQSELSEMDALASQEALSGPNWSKVSGAWRKFRGEQGNLGDSEADQLFGLVRTAAPAAQQAARRLKGRVSEVQMTPEGPQVVVQDMESTAEPAPISVPASVLGTLKGSGPRAVVTSSGAVVRVAPITAEAVAQMPNQYPAVVGDDGVPRWAPSRAQRVSSAVRQAGAQAAAGGSGQVWLGEHPALDGQEQVIFTLPAKVKRPKGAEALGRVNQFHPWGDDDEDDEGPRVVNKFRFVQPADAVRSIVEAAQEFESLGAGDVEVYAHTPDYAGWTRAGVALHSDGIQTTATPIARQKATAGNTLPVWVRKTANLPDDHVQASGTFVGDLTVGRHAWQDGRLVPLEDGQEAPVVVSRTSHGVTVSTDPTADLVPALDARDSLTAAGLQVTLKVGSKTYSAPPEPRWRAPARVRKEQ